MRKLPSIQGLRDSNALTVKFSPTLLKLIETTCRAEWLELNKLDHSNETASPFIPADEWLSSREGRTHSSLFDTYFLQTPPSSQALSATELSRMLSRLQAQRHNVRGTRKRFEARVHSATDYRKFRNWWINDHFSKLAKLPFNEPCPFNSIAQEGPTESYITIGQHFEEWTGHKLPQEAWKMLEVAETDRADYSNQFKNLKAA